VDGASAAALMHHWSALLRGVAAAALPTPMLDRVAYDVACGVRGQVCAARQAQEAEEARRAARAAQPRGSCWCGTAAADADADELSAADVDAAEPAADDAAPAAPAASVTSTPAATPREVDMKTSAAAQLLPTTSPLGGMTVWPSPGGWARMLLRIATDSSLGFAPGRAAAVRMILPFPSAELARLKAAASAGAAAAGRAEEAARLSTNDALCAAVWRALGASRRRRGPADLTGACPSTFTFVANTRQLVLPRAQQVFIGNATVLVQAALPAAAMRAASLADAASALRAAKAALTPDAVRAEMAFLQAHADAGERNIRWNSLTLDGAQRQPFDAHTSYLHALLTRTVLNTGGAAMWDWSKFPIYDLEFCGAKPFWCAHLSARLSHARD
jgi:hypothetical protein